MKQLSFEQELEILKNKIKNTINEGVTLDEAEKLAAEFLYAQSVISDQLKIIDLDARMKKTGNKSIRAVAYLDIIKGVDKKPTEAQISALIETDEVVSSHQGLLDKAEVNMADLERYYNIFQNAYHYYRGISKGKFE